MCFKFVFCLLEIYYYLIFLWKLEDRVNCRVVSSCKLFVVFVLCEAAAFVVHEHIDFETSFDRDWSVAICCCCCSF